MRMANNSTVFLVDDDRAVRDSLRFLMKSVGHRIECFGSAEDFLESYDPDLAGCLVLDVRIPGMSGIELMGKLAKIGCRLPVIIITGHADVPMAVQAMKDGALYVLEKPFKDQVLLDLIHAAFEKNAQLRKADAERAEIGARLTRLTPREREVLDYLIQGMIYKEIAQKIRISRKTLWIHRARIFEKMGVTGLPDLVKMVLQVKKPS
jgi:two-component system, LuxR family, response regulator FixJ